MTVVIDFFRVLATFTSTVMLLSPAPMIWNVWKTKQTGVASIVPLVAMLANSNNIMTYGYLTEHYFPIFSTYVVGDVLCVVYVTIFYIYSPEKAKAHRTFLLFGIPTLLLSIYAFLGGFGITGQPCQQVGNVFAFVGIVTNVLLFAAPFEKILLVLKHRSAVFINIHMVCAGAVTNSVWVAYTALTDQWIILGYGVFCVVAGCIQIIFYLIFLPSTHPYDGPIPGVTQSVPTSEQVVDIELGQKMVSPKARTKSSSGLLLEAQVFVALESPLEPPNAHNVSLCKETKE